MSRFAINPKWLIYLPPTMSPSETSQLGDYLEYPREAFHYYTRVGVDKLVCEEKHMGSRAVVIVGRDEKVIERRFGIVGEGIGTVYTRTGRNFFNEKNIEQDFLTLVNTALEQSGFYDRFETDWVCLDAELMPWSAKAQNLLQSQYSAVGTAATHALQAVVEQLVKTGERQAEAHALLERYSGKKTQVEQFVDAYRRYCWSVNTITDYKLAPFHILATEGKTWVDQNHEWHMDNIQAICEAGAGIVMSTPFKIVHLHDEASMQEATDWWLSLTEKGGEGLVVKPYHFVHANRKGLVQPAIKIRGREYLRIIYGPEYTAPENLSRLRSRGLSGKRSLALREFALGLEALERFIRREPLRRVHECVFGVLALESEPVDPRL
jgi:protein phosphatase